MTTVFDVPPDKLIPLVAEKLKGDSTITPPDWAPYVKTGIHREKVPTQSDWWYTRVAAVFRKVYVKGPIGTERLASEFGGYRDRGSRPNKAVKGSRSIVRHSLMQLEAAGYVEKNKNRGRIVSAKGRKLLDNTANDIWKGLKDECKGLEKY